MDQLERLERDYEIARSRGARPRLLGMMEEQLAKLRLRPERTRVSELIEIPSEDEVPF